VAPITPGMPDALSHASVRARNSRGEETTGLALVTC